MKMASATVEKKFELTLKLNEDEATELFNLLNRGVSYEVYNLAAINSIFGALNEVSELQNFNGRPYSTQAQL